MGIRPNQYFWLKDGTQIKNLYELASNLEKMPKAIFQFHVNKSKNDFSAWIKEVIKDKVLAEKVNAIKTAKTMSKYIKAKIKPGKKKEIKTDKEIKTIKSIKVYHPDEKETLMDKIKKFVFIEDKKELMQATPTTTFGSKCCPYKSFNCCYQEFLVGIVIGLAIGLFLRSIF